MWAIHRASKPGMGKDHPPDLLHPGSITVALSAPGRRRRAASSPTISGPYDRCQSPIKIIEKLLNYCQLLPIVANYCLRASWLSWCSMQFAQVEPIVETDPEEKEESVWSSVCKEGWSSFYIHVSSTCAFDDLIGCIRSLPVLYYWVTLLLYAVVTMYPRVHKRAAIRPMTNFIDLPIIFVQ